MMKDKAFGKINKKQREAINRVMSRTNGLLISVNTILETTEMESEPLNVANDGLRRADFLADFISDYSGSDRKNGFC